jgi:hypothetical protein
MHSTCMEAEQSRLHLQSAVTVKLRYEGTLLQSLHKCGMTAFTPARAHYGTICTSHFAAQKPWRPRPPLCSYLRNRSRCVRRAWRESLDVHVHPLSPSDLLENSIRPFALRCSALKAFCIQMFSSGCCALTLALLIQDRELMYRRGTPPLKEQGAFDILAGLQRPQSGECMQQHTCLQSIKSSVALLRLARQPLTQVWPLVLNSYRATWPTAARICRHIGMTTGHSGTLQHGHRWQHGDFVADVPIVWVALF